MAEGIGAKLDQIITVVGEVKTDVAVIKSQIQQTDAGRRLTALEAWQWRTIGGLAVLALVAPPVWNLVLR